MTLNLLRFPAKRLRANYLVQKAYRKGHTGVLCFSCGNSSAALRNAVLAAELPLIVLDISPHGDLTANRWFTQLEIARIWPDFLDGTSGHVTDTELSVISNLFRHYLGELGPGPWYVPTGSGETILALALAYPHTSFVPVYSLDEWTQYNEEAPRNEQVRQVNEPIYDPTGISWIEKNC